MNAPPPPDDISFGGSSNATESTVSSLETLEDSNDEDNDSSNTTTTRECFQVGDHVYTWCSLLALPRAYQHHGIVVHVSTKCVKIIDFYPLFVNGDEQNEKGKTACSSAIAASGSDHSNGRQFNMSKVILDPATARKEWKRVDYNVAWTERFIRRSGTCSSVVPDNVGFVLSRIEFLQENAHVVPRYDELMSNCECVAVWCKTGTFCSLQGSALLGGVANSSLKATAVSGLAVSATSVTVPCAGVWGWLGFTSTIPLTTAAPLLMPAIVAGGVASTIPPLVIMQRCKQEWKNITKHLNVCLAQGCRQGLYLPHAPRFQSI